MKAKNIDDPSEKPVEDWTDVAALLDQGDFMSLDNDGPPHFSTWLTTLNADGSPHVTAIGAAWDGKTFWFQTADHTRKARNIDRDPRCLLQGLGWNDRGNGSRGGRRKNRLPDRESESVCCCHRQQSIGEAD